MGLGGEIKERGGNDAGTSATTSDTEVARNPRQPEGWRRDGIDSLSLLLHDVTDIASSLLRELDAVALATNVMVFLGRDTTHIVPFWSEVHNYTINLQLLNE